MLKELLNKILLPDPETRITLAQIMEHAWYVSGESRSIIEKKSEIMASATDMSSGSAASELPRTMTSTPQTTVSAEFKQMTIFPSQADMDSAIQENALVEEDDLSPEGSAVPHSGPKAMNAFDLINMCGGLALKRLIQVQGDQPVGRYTRHRSADVIGRLEKTKI